MSDGECKHETIVVGGTFKGYFALCGISGCKAGTDGRSDTPEEALEALAGPGARSRYVVTLTKGAETTYELL